MKKQYIAPEAKLLCFVAQQQLASTDIEMDDLLAAAGIKDKLPGNAVNPSENDIGLDIF